MYYFIVNVIFLGNIHPHLNMSRINKTYLNKNKQIISHTHNKTEKKIFVVFFFLIDWNKIKNFAWKFYKDKYYVILSNLWSVSLLISSAMCISKLSWVTSLYMVHKLITHKVVLNLITPNLIKDIILSEQLLKI